MLIKNKLTFKLICFFWFQVMRAHQQLESPQWLTGGGGNSRLFDFPTVSSGGDWGVGLISSQHPLYGSLAQQ